MNILKPVSKFISSRRRVLPTLRRYKQDAVKNIKKGWEEGKKQKKRV